MGYSKKERIWKEVMERGEMGGNGKNMGKEVKLVGKKGWENSWERGGNVEDKGNKKDKQETERK